MGFSCAGGGFFPELSEKDKQYILDIAEAIKRELGIEFDDIKDLPEDTEIGFEAEKIHQEYKRWILKEIKLKGLAADVQKDT